MNPMKHALFIIAPENFRDEELFVPQKILEENGIKTTIASREPGICRGSLGNKVEAVIGLNQINAEDFEAIIFVGGGGSQIFRDDLSAHLIARKAIEKNKILAAICAGPTILAAAGILKNKKATVFPDQNLEKILIENGANLSKESVTVDGNLITADGPDSAAKFGKTILEKLKP